MSGQKRVQVKAQVMVLVKVEGKVQGMGPETGQLKVLKKEPG